MQTGGRTGSPSLCFIRKKKLEETLFGPELARREEPGGKKQMSYSLCEQVGLSSSQTQQEAGPGSCQGLQYRLPSSRRGTDNSGFGKPTATSPQALSPPGFPVYPHPKQKLGKVSSKCFYSDPAPSFPGWKRLV